MHTSQKRLELRNNAAHKIGKMMEQFEQRLTLANLRLSERYFNFELRVLVHFQIGKASEQYVADFQRAHPTGQIDQFTHPAMLRNERQILNPAVVVNGG